jgi:MFS transporter, putative metabolite:H+ symporter
MPSWLPSQKLPKTEPQGFVYAWSRLSAMFSSFIIAFMLKDFGVTGVFVFISGAMALVMLAIGVMGPRTLGQSLENISH